MPNVYACETEFKQTGDLYIRRFLTISHKSIFLTQNERDGDILVTFSLRVKKAVWVFLNIWYCVAQWSFRVTMKCWNQNGSAKRCHWWYLSQFSSELPRSLQHVFWIKNCDTVEGEAVWIYSSSANISASHSVCGAEERQVSPKRSFRFTTLHGVTFWLCQVNPTSSPNAMIGFGTACWAVTSSGMRRVSWSGTLRRVVWSELTDVWEESIAPVFSIWGAEHGTIRSSETSMNLYEVILRHIPEESALSKLTLGRRAWDQIPARTVNPLPVPQRIRGST